MQKVLAIFFFFHFAPHINVWLQIDCCLCLSPCALVFNWQIKWPKLKSSVSRALYFKSHTTNVNKSNQEIKQEAEGRQGHKFSVFSSGGDKYAKTNSDFAPHGWKKHHTFPSVLHVFSRSSPCRTHRWAARCSWWTPPIPTRGPGAASSSPSSRPLPSSPSTGPAAPSQLSGRWTTRPPRPISWLSTPRSVGAHVGGGD